MAGIEALDLDYVIDTDGATRVMQFSWLNSPYFERALTHIVNQRKSCFCYGVTVAEAVRAALNLKNDTDTSSLSTMEIVNNCHGQRCKGYHSAIALEWIKEEGLVEEARMRTRWSAKPTKAKAEGGPRYSIDEWEPIPNLDADIMTNVIRQPVIVSLDCPNSLHETYRGGLVDPYLMQMTEPTVAHSMLITGFGFYVMPNKSIKNFWQLKNSMGVESGDNGYVYILQNSSQPIDKFVILDPLVPLVYAPGEVHEERHLVKNMSFAELAEIDRNPHLDIIILFYVGTEDNQQIFKDFRRVSRMYLAEDDVIFVQVDVTEDRCGCVKYASNYSQFPSFPVMIIYKNIVDEENNTPIRDLTTDGEFLTDFTDFQKLAAQFVNIVGGRCGLKR